MSIKNLEIGDIVRFTSDEWAGISGIVSQPITKSMEGHVLVFRNGYILGVTATLDDVIPAEVSSAGYVQLAYNLIKLGSHVIEQRML